MPDIKQPIPVKIDEALSKRLIEIHSQVEDLRKDTERAFELLTKAEGVILKLVNTLTGLIVNKENPYEKKDDIQSVLDEAAELVKQISGEDSQKENGNGENGN